MTLFLNGKEIKTKKNKLNKQNHIFLFRNIRLEKGKNTVIAKGSNGVEDSVEWKLK